MKSVSQVGLVPGMGASRDWECFPWIEEELVSRGLEVRREVIDSRALGSFRKTPEEWIAFASSFLHENSVVVGHSVGGISVLRALESYEGEPLKAVVLMASYARVFQSEKQRFAQRIIPLLELRPFDWEHICSKVEQVLVWGSKNDPYVPVEEVEFLAEQLGVSPRFFKRKGHFGGAQFPALRHRILQLAS